MNMGNNNLQHSREDTLAFRVETSRRDLGLSKSALAERSGVSRGHISKIEAGKATNLRRETLEALAEALEVAPSYLLAFIEPDDEDEDDAEKYIERSPLARRLLDIFIQLPLRDQKLLVAVATTMAEADQPRIIGSTE